MNNIPVQLEFPGLESEIIHNNLVQRELPGLISEQDYLKQLNQPKPVEVEIPKIENKSTMFSTMADIGKKVALAESINKLPGDFAHCMQELRINYPEASAMSRLTAGSAYCATHTVLDKVPGTSSIDSALKYGLEGNFRATGPESVFGKVFDPLDKKLHSFEDTFGGKSMLEVASDYLNNSKEIVNTYDMASSLNSKSIPFKIEGFNSTNPLPHTPIIESTPITGHNPHMTPFPNGHDNMCKFDGY